MLSQPSRRDFLLTSAATAGATAGASLAGLSGAAALAAESAASPNARPTFGYIGAGIRYHNLIGGACRFGPCAAIADVDGVQLGRGVQSARQKHGDHRYPIDIRSYEDYRRILDRQDINAVVIATPDHWHTKIAVEAIHAGKDVYCEKPLTLTIRDGQLIREALKKHPRVFQVGTQQRTEMGRRFATAAAIARAGRIGKISRVTCGIDGSLTSPSLPVAQPPAYLNWDKWLGPAPLVDYRESANIRDTSGYGAGHPLSRTHNYFRWWYEYSGGKLTDWGAHHVDAALWALQKTDGPVGVVSIDPMMVEHPVPFDSDGMPTQDDRFNTATKFHVRCTFEDGLELDVRNGAPDLGFGNGIMFQGEKGRYFVNRGKLTGKVVDQLATNPLPDDAYDKLYGRKVVGSHMGDFVECMNTRNTPVSDVESHHRALSICHAVNIAMRLGRKLSLDTQAEKFVDDEQANRFIERPHRKGYEIDV